MEDRRPRAFQGQVRQKDGTLDLSPTLISPQKEVFSWKNLSGGNASCHIPFTTD